MSHLFKITRIGFIVFVLALAGIQAGRGAVSAYSLQQQIESAQENILSGDIGFAREDIADALDNAVTLEKTLNLFFFLHWVPFFGGQYDAAQVILDAGKSLLAAGLDTVEIADEVISVLKTDRKGTTVKDFSANQKKEVFQNFFRKSPELKGAHAQVSLSLARLSQLQGRSLVYPLSTIRADLHEKGAELNRLFGIIAPFLETGPRMLGFPAEKKYLLLLQNNTEVRATGGFIGTYGVVALKDGDITNVRTDNVYNLDDRATHLRIPPPEPFLRYFPPKERWWYLRDSNWSPDYPESARQAMFFFEREGGKEKIDGVIALTPDVISSLLGVVGAVQIEGRTFDERNFTDELQYQVEQGYARRGIQEHQRKEIVGSLMREIVRRMYDLPSERLHEIVLRLKRSLDEKHILLYFTDPDTQSFALASGFAGEVRQKEKGDYIMVVDSNMGSMKTDAVIKKNISYTVTEEKDGTLTARVELAYQNTGTFTWKTTSYKDYVRLYVPAGSMLIKGVGFQEKEGSTKQGKVDILAEHGKLGFGAFFIVEPGASHTAVFEYRLPERVRKEIAEGSYDLLVQKQAGLSTHHLKAQFAFKKKARLLAPQEGASARADGRIGFETPLYVDREIKLQF